MREYNFEWYVLNENFNTRKIEPFNIFQNISLYEAAVELCEEYNSKDMAFDDFVERLRRLVQWQEWSRREYEIMVAPLWSSEDEMTWKKIDCYQQVEPNIKLVARHVLSVYSSKKKM